MKDKLFLQIFIIRYCVYICVISLALIVGKSYNNPCLSILSLSSIIVFLPLALWESSDFFSSLFELLSLHLGALPHVSIDVQKGIFNGYSKILLQRTPNCAENRICSWNNFNGCLRAITGKLLNPSHASLAHFGLCNCSWHASSFWKNIFGYLAECEQSGCSNTEIHRFL